MKMKINNIHDPYSSYFNKMNQNTMFPSNARKQTKASHIFGQRRMLYLGRLSFSLTWCVVPHRGSRA